MANYLYNGVELLDIRTKWASEYDGVPAPYGIIASKNGSYVLYVSSVPFVRVNQRVQLNDAGIYVKYRYSTVSGAAWLANGQGLNPHDLNCDEYIWTSHDILNEDGSVYLAASDPIPVGGEPIDPTSFMQGWLVGRRLAGMRK